MDKNKQTSKLTKSELIKTGILSIILALVFIYSLYKSAEPLKHNSTLLIICTVIGLVILFLSIYVGTKMGLKIREQKKNRLPTERKNNLSNHN